MTSFRGVEDAEKAIALRGRGDTIYETRVCK